MSQIVLNSVTNKIVFRAIDELDSFSPLTGLTSFTVYYSLNGGAATAMTTPTVSEISSANMPGVYFLDIDEAGMTSAIGDLEVYITVTGMIPVYNQIDIINATGGASAADVWGYATRLLTAGTNISLAKGTGLTGLNDIAAVDVWSVGSRTLTSFGTLVSDIWANSTRTLTAFSTSLALSVWDVLESAIVTASSIGLKVKTNLDDTVSSRSTYAGGAVASVTGNIGGNVTGSVGSVTSAVTVGTNNDKTGYSIGTGGITSTSFAAGAIDAASLAADATTELTAGIRIKKNTVLSNFMFLMVDSTDHVTPKTGLTITATRSIDGAAFAACANSATEVSNGMYKINLANTDLNGDVITLRFTATGADARLITIITTT